LCEHKEDICAIWGSPADERHVDINKKSNKHKDEVNNYLTESDYSWSYRFEFLGKDGKPPKFEKYNMCKHSFVLPRLYSGGIGILVDNLPGKVKTLIRIDKN